MVDGATARGEELGWTVDVQAPTSEGDFAAFVTTVQQLLEKGVDGLSINPIGTDSAVTAVKAANEKGVPILAHNFITPFSEGDVASYIGYDQWGGAEKLAADDLRAHRRQVRLDAGRDGRQGLHPARHRQHLLAPAHRRLQGRPREELPQRRGGRRADRQLAAPGRSGRGLRRVAGGPRHRRLLWQQRRDGHRGRPGRRAARQGHQRGLLRGRHRRQPAHAGPARARASSAPRWASTR